MRKRFSRKPPKPCAEVEPDDGVELHAFHRSSRGHAPNRKALQLCEQVMRTLSCVLAGECGDSLLQGLLVESVQPFPDSTRLLVSVYPGPSAQEFGPQQILEKVQGAARMLRTKVALAIHRKRAPELVYRVVVPVDS